jgi:N-acetylmuramic acid 6-phosphate etherase
MEMIPTTEQDSLYPGLSGLTVGGILSAINTEDRKVAVAVGEVLPSIEKFVKALVDKMQAGGRLFYIGAGTSGRLGIVDASECPPTYGVPQGMVIGIIAGGDSAIRKAVEFAEDDMEQAYKDLSAHNINEKDVVLGLSASGKTPYVLGGLKACRANNILTASVCCNSGTIISRNADHPIEVVVGPEIVTGSTRMKSGTAQKLVLNMITTATMIKLGHVEGSKMVDMQLSNDKLIDRGARMVMEKTMQNYEDAKALLLRSGNVRKAIEAFNTSV